MRVRAAALALLSLAGCGEKPALGVASPLVEDGLNPFTLERGYLVDLETSGHLDAKSRLFSREGRQRLRRADGAQPEPAEVARVVEDWVAARVAIKDRSSDASAPREIRRTLRYDSRRTTGKLKIIITPSATGQTVFLDFEIEEKLR